MFDAGDCPEGGGRAGKGSDGRQVLKVNDKRRWEARDWQRRGRGMATDRSRKGGERSRKGSGRPSHLVLALFDRQLEPGLAVGVLRQRPPAVPEQYVHRLPAAVVAGLVHRGLLVVVRGVGLGTATAKALGLSHEMQPEHKAQAASQPREAAETQSTGSVSRRRWPPEDVRPPRCARTSRRSATAGCRGGRPRWPRPRLRRWRVFCHFADTPSPSILKRLLKGEGGAAE